MTFVPNSKVSALDGSGLGSRAQDELWHALKGRVGELHAAGDCLAPRSVEAAMTEGAKAARVL